MRTKEFYIVVIALLVSLILTVAKFTAYFVTDSVAILSDALESIINVVAGGFACFSIYLASKPKDANHPYGHGKVEFFSIGFEGAMIFIAGCLILFKAIQYFIHPHPIARLTYGLFIVAGAGIVNCLLGLMLLQSGRRLSSITLSGNGQHILTDAWSSLGLILALVLIRYTKWGWLDPAASVILGSLIIFKGYSLVRRSVSGLMDEADMAVIDRVAKILTDNRRSAWIDIHNMRIQQYGNNYHIDCHLTLPYYYTLEQVHTEIKALEDIVRKGLPGHEVELFVHPDPCRPDGCPYCILKDCAARQSSLRHRLPWTRDNILPNRRHAHLQKDTTEFPVSEPVENRE